MCMCSWELEMFLSTNLCPQTCILTPHQSTLLPCEIPLVGWSSPLWFLLRADCLGPHAGWFRASPRVGDTAASLGILLTPMFNHPHSKKRKLLSQVKISRVSAHFYCLCPPLETVGLHLLLTPVSSCIHQGGSPWSHLSLGLNKHSSPRCSTLSQKLQPHNILAARHWPCISVSISCHREPKMGQSKQ